MRPLLLLLVLGCADKAKDEEIAKLKAEVGELAAAASACRVALQRASGPPDIDVAELDARITAGANGPADIERAISKIRGGRITVRGTVYEVRDDNAVSLRGGGEAASYALCQFEAPTGLRPGMKAAFSGIVAGYFMETQLDRCVVVK